MLTNPLSIAFFIAALTAPGAPVDLDHGDLAELAERCLEVWPAEALA